MTPEAINLFSPTYRKHEILSEIEQCLDRGWTGLGYKTLEFEQAWKEYAGFAHAHFVNSATAGLELALDVLGKDSTFEIITSPLTFVATNHSILRSERGMPHFVDVDHYLCLDPDEVEAAINERTRAVLFVGLGGNTGSLRKIIDICKRRQVALILDAAHMAGTRWRGGGHVGTEADATVFSFHSVKNLPTADSGAVCFKRADHDALARQLSWHGIDKDTYTRSQPVAAQAYRWRYDVPEVGMKGHGNSIMAAMALVGLRYLDHDNAYRRQLATWYDEQLPESVRFVPMSVDCESSRHLYQIRVKNRDAVLSALNAAGIFPGVHYELSTTYPMYANTFYAETPRARAAADELISLPMHMKLTRKDVDRIAAEVARATRG